MIVPCAGRCGTRLSAPEDGRVYLCRRCWTALLSTIFDLIRRGNEVFTVVRPQGELLN